MYDHSTKSPLILAGPGLGALSPSVATRKGHSIANPIYLHDLAPTILDLVGLSGALGPSDDSTLSEHDGLSLVPLLLGTVQESGPARVSRKYLILAYREFQRAVIHVDSGLKLIHYYDQQHTSHPHRSHSRRPIYSELFALRTDPWELENLLAKSATPIMDIPFEPARKDLASSTVASLSSAICGEFPVESTSCRIVQGLSLEIQKTEAQLRGW